MVFTPRPPETPQLQRSNGRNLPTEKNINRKINDSESDFRLKHASGAFGPVADWRRHATWHRRALILGLAVFVLCFGELRLQGISCRSFGWSCLILTDLVWSWQILSVFLSFRSCQFFSFVGHLWQPLLGGIVSLCGSSSTSFCWSSSLRSSGYSFGLREFAGSWASSLARCTTVPGLHRLRSKVEAAANLFPSRASSSGGASVVLFLKVGLAWGLSRAHVGCACMHSTLRWH